jgi:hypothetical protein
MILNIYEYKTCACFALPDPALGKKMGAAGRAFDEIDNGYRSVIDPARMDCEGKLLNAGPSTALAAKNAASFAQDDRHQWHSFHAGSIIDSTSGVMKLRQRWGIRLHAHTRTYFVERKQRFLLSAKNYFLVSTG